MSGRYGVCKLVVLLVVEVCVDYGGVDVLHVCLDFRFIGVGVCVNVCGVVKWVWGVVIFILYVIRIVGCVPSLIVCVCFVL